MIRLPKSKIDRFASIESLTIVALWGVVIFIGAAALLDVIR